jgi:hypothetical protein
MVMTLSDTGFAAPCGACHPERRGRRPGLDMRIGEDVRPGGAGIEAGVEAGGRGTT